MNICEYISKNKEWLFSGLAVAIIGFILNKIVGQMRNNNIFNRFCKKTKKNMYIIIKILISVLPIFMLTISILLTINKSSLTNIILVLGTIFYCIILQNSSFKNFVKQNISFFVIIVTITIAIFLTIKKNNLESIIVLLIGISIFSIIKSNIKKE